MKLLENEVQRLERERKANVKQKKAEAAKRAARAAVPQNTVKRGGLRFAPAPGRESSEQAANATIKISVVDQADMSNAIPEARRLDVRDAA